jgi:hypothetical protein
LARTDRGNGRAIDVTDAGPPRGVRQLGTAPQLAEEVSERHGRRRRALIVDVGQEPGEHLARLLLGR